MNGIPKKLIEARVLTSARLAGAPIPTGETPGEAPDFRFDSGMLGIEVSEVIRPASSNFGIVPAEAESFHHEIIRRGQEVYSRTADAVPVHVSVYFTHPRGQRQNKQDMARALADFVKANLPNPDQAVSFDAGIPEGFNTISILRLASVPNTWWSGEHGGYSLSHIYEQLTSRVGEKNKLIPTYRANLKRGAAVWLLLYSDTSVSRSMSVPHGIEQWQLPFDFDRVFWFLCLENQVVEMKRADSAQSVAFCSG